MSGAGKMTTCRAVEPQVRTMDYPVQVLDGDEVRQNLNLSRDRGFSKADRDENNFSYRLRRTNRWFNSR
jgi:adenylylsulfate kinase-like enzyme